MPQRAFATHNNEKNNNKTNAFVRKQPFLFVSDFASGGHAVVNRRGAAYIFLFISFAFSVAPARPVKGPNCNMRPMKRCLSVKTTSFSCISFYFLVKNFFTLTARHLCRFDDFFS